MSTKKIIYIAAGLGIVADVMLLIFQPSARVDAGIGLAAMAVLIYMVRTSKKIS